MELQKVNSFAPEDNHVRYVYNEDLLEHERVPFMRLLQAMSEPSVPGSWFIPDDTEEGDVREEVNAVVVGGTVERRAKKNPKKWNSETMCVSPDGVHGYRLEEDDEGNTIRPDEHTHICAECPLRSTHCTPAVLMQVNVDGQPFVYEGKNTCRQPTLNFLQKDDTVAGMPVTLKSRKVKKSYIPVFEVL